MHVDFLPQKGVRSSQFIPPEYELPEGWSAAMLGFNLPGIPYWGSDEVTSQANRSDFLVTHLNLVTDYPNHPGRATNGLFMMTIFHNHHRKQLQMSQKAILTANNFGTGANPYILKTPYLIPAGDQITVQISTYMSAQYSWGPGGNPAVYFGLAPESLAPLFTTLYASFYLTMIGGQPSERG